MITAALLLLAGFRLVPEAIAPDAKPATDYLTCRKRAFEAEFRQGMDESEPASGPCRKQFPISGRYLRCKAAALKVNLGAPEATKAAVTHCRDAFRALSFDPAVAIPFKIADSETYFADIDLTLPLRLDDITTVMGAGPESEFGNFNCSRIRALASGGEPATLALFGTSIVTEQCVFARHVTGLFEGLTMFFRYDAEPRVLLPYIGAAFYREIAGRRPQLKAMLDDVLAVLGPGYAVVATRLGLFYVARRAIETFSAEGFPLDLCKTPNDDSPIVILETDPSANHVRMLLFVQTRFACGALLP